MTTTVGTMPWQVNEQGEYNIEKEIAEDVLEVLKNMPPTVGPRMIHLYADGTVRPTDFDRDCLADMARLALPLMEKVVEHCEGERGFLANSRSKSGFLRSMCMRAKRGELDPRGYGAVDPWKNHINSMVNYDKKTRVNNFKLEPEDEFLEQVGHDATIAVAVKSGLVKQFDQEEVELRMPITASVIEICERLKSDGISWPLNKMRLRHAKLGFLKMTRTLGYYNVAPEETLELELCMNLRGNKRKIRKNVFNKRASEVAA